MRILLVVPATAPRTVVRAFFLALAIACLGTYGYDFIGRTLYQRYESREFDQSTGRTANSIATVSEEAISPAPIRHSSLNATAVIGRLSFPRLRQSAMVREGIDRHTLQIAVGHIPATALPGQSGNIALAGHRDTFFRGLKDLRSSDEIRLSGVNGDFRYVVETLRIVDPSNVEVLASSAENTLTLVTCYPFSYVGAAPKRFVVRARQVLPAMVVEAIVE